MSPRGLTVGTFFGIELRIHYSWLVVFALIATTVITDYLPTYRHGLALWVRVVAGLLVTALFFISVICHEYAHSLVALRQGLKIKRITLFLFGGAAELQQEPTSAKAELLMTTAGPATSLAIAALSGAVWTTAHQLNLTGVELIAEPLTMLNFVVGIFNLLPAYPLDGGRIFRSLVWLRTKDIVSATRTASYLSYGLSYAMVALGVLEILAGAYVSGIWLGFLGMFLHQITQLSYSQTVSQKTLEQVKVRDIMDKQFLTVPADTTVDTFVNKFILRDKRSDYLVTEGNEVVGIVELLHIVRVRRIDNQQPVKHFVVPLIPELKLKPKDLAARALRIMQLHSVHTLPVFTGSAVVGIVSAQYLNDYLQVHQTLNAAKAKQFGVAV